MHKLEIKLKQHTPLIHFQHDQEGATLRASEVKPKLDKFIVERDFENDFDKCKQYLIGYATDPNTLKSLKEKFDKGYRALNYKIRIESKMIKDSIKLQSEMRINGGQRKYYSYWRRLENGKTEDFPLMLSNMGGKEDEGKLMNFAFYEDITMTITTSEVELYDSIAYYIDLFFAFNNFGQRSSKGFGSFSVVKVNGEVKAFPHEEFESDPYMEYRFSDEICLDSFYKLFQTVDFYWKCLKSGVNYTRKGQFKDRYIKAYLWTYLNEDIKEKQTWEKRTIKEFFHLTTGNEKPENPHPASFARAMLGCPDKFEYKEKGETISIKHAEDPKSDDFIARIPSPIIFKPIMINKEKKIRIYLVFDYIAIKKLRTSSNLQFKFESRNNSMCLNVNPDAIKIKNLIKNYHSFIRKNNWGRKAFYKQREYNDFIDKYDLEDETWFIPLDFNWKRIINTPVILK